jgi:hypothetical protein
MRVDCDGIVEYAATEVHGLKNVFLFLVQEHASWVLVVQNEDPFDAVREMQFGLDPLPRTHMDSCV